MSIVILSTNAFAEKCSNFSTNFSFSSDVGFGNQYFKSLSKNFKKHGVCIVEKSNGHPTRLGQQSLRFEVKPGDCGYNNTWDDCKTDRERHELSGLRHNDGEHWFSWSIFLPDNFINIYPTKLAMGQFHQEKGHVVWMFQNSTGGYFVDNQVYGYTSRTDNILNQKEMLGKWNDILINANWTHKENGFFRVWVNGKLSFKYNGPTKSKGKKVYQKFGVYRSFMTRYKMNKKTDKVPGQVVYFDEVRTGKSCNKIKLEELGYNCNDLLASLN
jgi:hypothetical protein